MFCQSADGGKFKEMCDMRKALIGTLVCGAITGSTVAALAQAQPTPPKSDGAAPASAVRQPGSELKFDFQDETIGAQPKSFLPIVGNFSIGAEGDNKVLVIDGRAWKQGQTATGVADRAKTLYGERYGEFLDNVKAFAYYPYAVANGVDDLRQGEISLRFKGISGRIDQGAGILFNLKPNGDYLTVRANPLENNLVLWKFEKGRRSSVKWVRDVPTPTNTWLDLKVVIKGNTVEGYLNGKLYLTHPLAEPVSGKIGVWSKADSHMYIDNYRVVAVP
jgi:hypothetical protein